MRIRKDEKTHNHFIRAGGVWVRDFTKPNSIPVTPNTLIRPADKALMVQNEFENRALNIGNICDEKLVFPKVVVISDGYSFAKRVDFINSLPEDVAIFAVNHVLTKWRQFGFKKAVNLYVVNNPYSEVMTFLPRKSKYYPACVASIRTNPKFLKDYKGTTYVYEPVLEVGFGQKGDSLYYIDDYRNPVCAAICLAYRMHAQKIMLVSCDESFSEKKDGAEGLMNGLYTYPQQLIAHDLIDANLYWFTKKKTGTPKAANYSDGPENKYATYITQDEQALAFFADEDEDA
jgi:hypothetical protein